MMPKKHKILWKNDQRVAVIRPDDPGKAIAMSKALIGKPAAESGEAFRMILYAQPYTYVGLAARDGITIVSESGHEIGKCAEGDSFVSYEQLLSQTPGDGGPEVRNLPRR